MDWILERVWSRVPWSLVNLVFRLTFLLSISRCSLSFVLGLIWRAVFSFEKSPIRPSSKVPGEVARRRRIWRPSVLSKQGAEGEWSWALHLATGWRCELPRLILEDTFQASPSGVTSGLHHRRDRQ